MTADYKQTDAHDLFVCLNKFIQDNDRSNDIEKRWLAFTSPPRPSFLHAGLRCYATPLGSPPPFSRRKHCEC